jgi:DNA helicase IV
MTERQKAQALLSVENYLSQIKNKIEQKMDEVNVLTRKLVSGLQTWYRGDGDSEVVGMMINNNRKEISDLQKMSDSPFFFKAEVKFSGNKDFEEIYISKYSLPEQKIYSWVTPIARLRYKEVGVCEYDLINGKKRSGEIRQREKFKIREGELISYEIDSGNEKIKVLDSNWREEGHFGLNEIIESLDVFQDEIIRIDPHGATLISGPAGSGKTTLALHKIAYLAQNIHTAQTFSPSQAVIFVQDRTTRDYFASLLPRLGLSVVRITTFDLWAMQLLDIRDLGYISSFPDPDYPLLVHAKYCCLQKKENVLLKTRNIYERLESVYFDEFDERSYRVFKKQKESGVLDRFDITILLRDKLKNYKIKDPYRLILIDEAENYLAQQLQIIRMFSSPATNSIIYVGDLVQQTFPFTIKNWEMINVRFPEQKKVIIPKVYRFTKQIRDYLISKGYSQDASHTLPGGPQVSEQPGFDLDKICHELALLQGCKPDVIIGVISNNDSMLDLIRNRFNSSEKLHFLTIQEAQGVEFDAVFLIFQEKQYLNRGFPLTLSLELAKVERDLFLVGVTRCKRDLRIFLI